ncbi:MAG: FecR domain-containing protein [Kiritimatiellae bacterium]|nr:FecR domain-containing protein [Kiritimatiellia bacterium]
MMDQAGMFRASVCVFAFSLLAVCAQEAAKTAGVETVSADGQTPTLAKLFEPLVRVMNIQGACEVKDPDGGKFVPALNNKFYPLGTVLRTGLGSSAVIIFSAQESVQMLEKSEVTVVCSKKNPEGRIVRLGLGKIKTVLRDNLPEGAFGIETPNATCQNVAGRGEYLLTTESAIETFQAATITGSARIEGAQYSIPALRAANTINIQTAPDRSLSRLTSVSGDFPIILENGTETPVSFGMSPKAVVKIWRENAPVGGRPIISTLVVSPTGIARHRFVYAEGRPDLTTGELIVPVEADKKEEELPLLLSVPGKDAGKPEVKEEKAAGQPPPAAEEKKESAQ